MNPARETPTVGVLYPGEMGAAVAAVLGGRGVRVVTTLDGRGRRTADRCRQAGVVVLHSLADVVREANVILSLVPPSAAADLAAACCELGRHAPAGAVYADVNSIGPELATAIGQRVERAGVAFVDAALNGLAKNLTTGGTLYLSGPRAADVAALFDGAVRLRILGPQIGRASAMKMLLAGLSKGVCALYAELALLAESRDLLGEFADATTMIYPGIAALVDRMLPTYAAHAARRASEMSELEQTMRAADLDPRVVAAVRRLHDDLATVSYDAPAATAAALIRRLAECGLLTSHEPNQAATAATR